MTDLRSEEQRVRDEVRQALRDQERRALAEAFYLTFTSEVGRAALKYLEREGCLYTTTLTSPHPDHAIDPIQSWANEGRRQLVILMHALIEEHTRGETPAKEKATSSIT